MVRPEEDFDEDWGGSTLNDEDRLLIEKAFDSISFEKDDSCTGNEDLFIETALGAVRLECCLQCQQGLLCDDVQWLLHSKLQQSLSFLDLPSPAREAVYALSLTTTSARLPWRPIFRYARHGLPIPLLLLNRQLNGEITKYVVSNNSFTVLVGHHVLPGTILTPLQESVNGVHSPPLEWITQLDLVLEVDLDLLLQPDYQQDESTAIQDETIFGTVAGMMETIEAAAMPILKLVTIMILEVVSESKRIHLTCSIDEREVKKGYESILQPLLRLGWQERLLVEDVDVVYYDTRPVEKTRSARWERADDYTLLWRMVLEQHGVQSTSSQDRASSSFTGNSTTRVFAQTLFSSFIPRLSDSPFSPSPPPNQVVPLKSPPGFPSHIHTSSLPNLKAQASPEASELKTSPNTERSIRLRFLGRNRAIAPEKPARSISRAGVLQRVLEGGAALTRRNTSKSRTMSAGATAGSISSSGEGTTVFGRSSTMPVAPAADAGLAKLREGTRVPAQGRSSPLSNVAGRRNMASAGKRESKALKYFAEGIGFTMDSFANVSSIVDDKDKGEKGRWSLM